MLVHLTSIIVTPCLKLLSFKSKQESRRKRPRRAQKRPPNPRHARFITQYRPEAGPTRPRPAFRWLADADSALLFSLPFTCSSASAPILNFETPLFLLLLLLRPLNLALPACHWAHAQLREANGCARRMISPLRSCPGDSALGEADAVSW
jgi:hypothetical protein